jgi:hypothetical protein
MKELPWPPAGIRSLFSWREAFYVIKARQIAGV